MLDLNALATFVEVADSRSFSGAARRLNIPRSTVSLRISTLEQKLGVRLFKRSTRVVTLTDDGRRLVDQVGAALRTLHSVENGFSSLQGEFVGTIRLSAPADFPTEGLAETITSFRERHPKVRIDAIMTNVVLDLVEYDIDLALRVGLTNHQDMVSRPAASFSYGFFASAEWVIRHGAPSHLPEIEKFIGPPRTVREFLTPLVFGGITLPEPIIETNNYQLILNLVQLGAGIGLIPVALCKQQIAAGEIIEVLGDLQRKPVHMSVAFATRKDITPRVRAFAEHLVENLRARE